MSRSLSPTLPTEHTPLLAETHVQIERPSIQSIIKKLNFLLFDLSTMMPFFDAIQLPEDPHLLHERAALIMELKREFESDDDFDFPMAVRELSQFTLAIAQRLASQNQADLQAQINLLENNNDIQTLLNCILPIIQTSANQPRPHSQQDTSNQKKLMKINRALTQLQGYQQAPAINTDACWEKIQHALAVHGYSLADYLKHLIASEPNFNELDPAVLTFENNTQGLQQQAQYHTRLFLKDRQPSQILDRSFVARCLAALRLSKRAALAPLAASAGFLVSSLFFWILSNLHDKNALLAQFKDSYAWSIDGPTDPNATFYWNVYELDFLDFCRDYQHPTGAQFNITSPYSGFSDSFPLAEFNSSIPDSPRALALLNTLLFLAPLIVGTYAFLYKNTPTRYAALAIISTALPLLTLIPQISPTLSESLALCENGMHYAQEVYLDPLTYDTLNKTMISGHEFAEPSVFTAIPPWASLLLVILSSGLFSFSASVSILMGIFYFTDTEALEKKFLPQSITDYRETMFGLAQRKQRELTEASDDDHEESSFLPSASQGPVN